jgi:hypothetical protein
MELEILWKLVSSLAEYTRIFYWPKYEEQAAVLEADGVIGDAGQAPIELPEK